MKYSNLSLQKPDPEFLTQIKFPVFLTYCKVLLINFTLSFNKLKKWDNRYLNLVIVLYGFK